MIAGTWESVRSLSTTRERWGETRAVVVARQQLEPGDPLDGVEIVEWPIALVPDDALTTRDRRAVVRRHVARGEVLTGADVGRGSGALGLAPDGWSVVNVPASPDQRALLSVGDAVTVVVAGRSVADGEAISIGSETIAVAVPRDAAAAVAEGVLQSSAAIVVG